MDEQFSYIVLAAESGGAPTGYRVILRDRTSGRQAVAQFDTVFAQVPVDDQRRDYEAPEWKAQQILTDAGLADAGEFNESLKDHLRAMLEENMPS